MKINKSIFLVVLFGFLSISLVYFKGVPVGADLLNHYRFALPFYDGLAQGNFLPGWLAESNNGFGDPRFRFYPPFLYYLLCLGKFLTGDWYYATILVFTFFSIVGTLGVYLWTRNSLSNRTAILAAFIFAIIPYHLTQFFQASLLAEFAATAFLPFGFLFVERISANGLNNKSNLLFSIAGLAAVFSLIIVTHIPTTVVASLSLGLFALLLTDWKSNKKSLIFCLLGILLGLISSSWFWFRMISELDWIQAGAAVSSAYYDYQNNFLLSPFSQTNLNTWFGNLLLILTIGYLLPSINLWKSIFSRKLLKDDFLPNLNLSEDSQMLKRKLFAVLMIVFFSIFMTTDLSRPLWAIIPKLKDIQFPYRWLLVTSVAVCPILAVSLLTWGKYIKTNGFRPLHIVLLLIFVISAGYTIAELVIESDFLDRNEFNEQIEKSRGARSFNDWLPKNSKELKDLLPLNGAINAGNREVSVINLSAEKRTFSIGAGNEISARVRTYNYPLWQAFILRNGKRIETSTKSEIDGTLLVTIPPEQVEIEVIFVEPSRTNIAVWVSFFVWFLISGFVFQGLIIGMRTD